MRYYKHIENGYIIALGTGSGYTEIAAEEYDRIMSVINDRPTPPVGYGYRLTAELEWELYKLPVLDDESIEDDTEAATADDYEAALAEFGVEV